MGAKPDFFQADQTYQRRRWLFQCLAVAPNPFNQEIRAVGFLYRAGEPATATALDPDDWANGEWLPAREGECECPHCGRPISTGRWIRDEHQPECPQLAPPF